MSLHYSAINIRRACFSVSGSRRNLVAPCGQSLMEFVLVLIFLTLVLTGGFTFGLGTFQAQQASDGVALPTSYKMDMANMPTNVGTGILLGYANGGGNGAVLDNIQISPVTPDISLLLGQKSIAPVVNFIPGFTIHTAQVMNQALLMPTATGGAHASPISTPPLPGGIPTPLPVLPLP